MPSVLGVEIERLDKIRDKHRDEADFHALPLRGVDADRRTALCHSDVHVADVNNISSHSGVFWHAACLCVD
jgi:hypothetical protein